MVITFLPYRDFAVCARVLDNKRLNKQRLECIQIINTLENDRADRLAKHPAVQMWKGYVDLLKVYHNAILKEWLARGYNSTTGFYDTIPNPPAPWWYGWQPLHLSHASSLLHKDYDYYRDKVPVIEKYMRHGYIYPTRLGAETVQTIEDPDEATLDRICWPINKTIRATYHIEMYNGKNVGLCTVPSRVVLM